MTTSPENQGKRWSKEDIEKIPSMLEKDTSHDDIAKELKRSTKSIQAQICIIASKMIDKKKKMNEVVEFTGLSQETIEKSIKSRDKKKDKKNDKDKSKKKAKDDSDSEDSIDPVDAKMIQLLTEIRDLLKSKKEKFNFDD